MPLQSKISIILLIGIIIVRNIENLEDLILDCTQRLRIFDVLVIDNSEKED